MIIFISLVHLIHFHISSMIRMKLFEFYQKLTGQKLDMEIEEEKTEEGTEQPK